MTDSELRIPPYNTECEQALLGTLLINNHAARRVSKFLLPEHFGNAVHGRIFAAIGELLGRGQIANPVTLKNLFDQDGALAEIGGAQYLARLAGAAASASINVEDYGRALQDLYLRRVLLIGLGEDIVNAAFAQNPDDPALKQIDRASKQLDVIRGEGRRGASRFDDEFQRLFGEFMRPGGGPGTASSLVGTSDEWRAWYNEYLLSDAWKALRAKVLDRCRRLCEGCRDHPVTQVHHLTYDHVGGELLYELVGLCDACHDRAHHR